MHKSDSVNAMIPASNCSRAAAAGRVSRRVASRPEGAPDPAGERVLRLREVRGDRRGLPFVLCPCGARAGLYGGRGGQGGRGPPVLV